MMDGPTAARGPKRSTALLWAAMAEVVLGGLVLALLTVFDADDGVPLGVPGAALVLAVAMAATAVGAASAAARAGLDTGQRRAVALLVAVAAGVLAALTIACFFSSNGSVAGLGIPLVLAVVGMNVVTARVAANRRRGTS